METKTSNSLRPVEFNQDEWPDVLDAVYKAGPDATLFQPVLKAAVEVCSGRLRSKYVE